MAETIGKGVLEVGFDPQQIAKAGQQQLLPSAKRLAGDIASTFAAVKLIDIGRQGIDELKQAAAAQSNVEAVIKSTGGVAGVTADHVDELADSQLKLTGVDDEVIKQGAAKLLCLEDKAQALTIDRGWVSHTDLNVGDFVLTFDPADDSIRWDPVDEMFRYQVDTELIRWKTKQIDVRTTPHHRWWTPAQSSRRYTGQFRTTEQVSGRHVRVQIGGGSPECFSGEPSLSDELVELIGWAATEGYFVGAKTIPYSESAAGRGGWTRVQITQSESANPLKVKQIRDLMGRLRAQGHRITERTDHLPERAPYNGCVMVTWGFARDLGHTIKTLIPDKRFSPQFLASLTAPQARLLLDTLIAGDGHIDAHGHSQYIQKDRGQLDDVAMLCAMLGIRTSSLGSRDSSAGSLYLCSTNYLHGQSTPAIREEYSGVVWCPRVRTGIFLARCRGRTFWTGNTFKAVANQVGAGNDVFDRATKLSLDLAQLGFGSVESASVLLGKALNDPVKGLTALQRVGVALTDSQKEQVKAFVASGDTLGAQKIILQEVESQVGGAAAAYGETLPGKIAIAEQSLENMKGSLVAAEAPLIELGAEGVAFLTDQLQELPDGAQAAVGGLVLVGGTAAALVRPVGDALRIMDALRASREAAALTNQALAVTEAQVAAGEAAIATNSAASVAGLYAEGGAAAAASAGLSTLAAAATLVVAPIAATAAFSALSDALGLTDTGFTELQDSLKAAEAGFDDFKDDAADFDAGKLTDDLNDLVSGNEDYATALQHAGVTTGDLSLAIIAGGESFDAFATKVKNAKGVTDEDEQAFGVLTEAINKQSEAALNAAVAKGQLGQADLDAASKQHLFKDGSVDQVAVLVDLADKGLISRDAIQGVIDASAEGPDSKKAEALASWYDAIRKNADEAFAATLKLAPADIRAREGRIAIADANDKVADAEEKLANFRKLGTPEQIADAERDLEKARLAQETAVLNEADALVALDAAQQTAAGGHQSNEEAVNLERGALELLNTQLTGPAHDAMAIHIFDLQVAINKARELRDLELIMSGAAPSLQVPGGGSESGPRPNNQPGVARAAGGPVGPGQVFQGGERGWEVLLTNGLYQAPPSGGQVLNHAQSRDFFGGRPAPSSSGVHIDAVNIHGDDASRALRRLPDELRAAAFLAGV